MRAPDEWPPPAGAKASAGTESGLRPAPARQTERNGAPYERNNGNKRIMKTPADRVQINGASMFKTACMAFACLFLSAMLPDARAQNVSIFDYKPPVSRARSLFFDLRYDYERDDGTALANDGDISFNYSRFYESLPFAYSIDADGVWSRSLLEDAASIYYAAAAEGRVKKYAWDEQSLFGSVSLNADYRKAFDRPASSVTVGIGWGRFINATALRKAERIDAFFSEENVTKRRLPAETLLEMAAAIERQREYVQRFGDDTYTKYWFEDLEKIVQKSGDLRGETIGASGALRMSEALYRENIGERYYGYDATLGLRYTLTQADSGADRPAPAADLSARYARPISWSSQIEGRAAWASPLDGDFGTAYRLTASAGYLYEAMNRIDFRLDYRLDMERFADGGDTVVSHAATPSFLFYIENEVRLLVSLSLIRADGKPWRRELTLTLNFKAL